jgi:hypothetical protein
MLIARCRWLLVLTALAAPAAYWLSVRSSEEIATAPAASPMQASPAVLPGKAVGAGEELIPELARTDVDPFAPRTWEPPPPPVVMAPVAPLPPHAPPLPFRFFGRIVDAGQPASFILLRGSETIAVRVGDRIEPAYLVDKFDGAHLHLVYLPLNIRQTIFIGNSNE